MGFVQLSWKWLSTFDYVKDGLFVSEKGVLHAGANRLLFSGTTTHGQ